MDIGKLPPQAIELEEVILGAMMIEKECINTVMDILKPESFYVEKNEIIFNTIASLNKRSFPVDLVTMTQELIKTKQLQNIGGASYLVDLTKRVASSANVEYHSRILQQKYIARELIRIGTETIRNAYEPQADCFSLVESLEKNLTALTRYFTGSKIQTPVLLWKQLIEKNNTLLEMKGLNGVPSGYLDLDRVTGGWQDGNMIVIAARPAMGKTALAINIACNASIQFEKPGVIFSLEMSALELFTRMVSAESEISNNQFNRKGIPTLELDDIGLNKCSKLLNADLFIDDTPGLSLLELKSKARKLKRDKDIQYIIIDYLQLMESGITNDRGLREQIISGISRGIKTLSKELGVPIIALSQLSRAVEQRGQQKRPMLSDLRESGAIEQDADMVIFIHRPEYYGITEDEHGASTEGVAEIIIEKHRNGPTGTVYLDYINYLTKFVPAAEKDLPAPENKIVEIQAPVITNAPNPNKFIESKFKLDDDEPF